MPREPDVFGQPTRPKSSSVARTTLRDLADLRPRRRPAPDRDRRAARRDDRDRRRAPDADAARGRRGSPSTRAPPRRAARLLRRCGRTETAARRPRSTAGRDSGARFWIEELAVDAVRIAHEHVRPAAGAAQRAVGDGEVVAHEIELGVAGLGEQHLARVRDRDLAAGDYETFVFGLAHATEYPFRAKNHRDSICRQISKYVVDCHRERGVPRPGRPDAPRDPAAPPPRPDVGWCVG